MSAVMRLKSVLDMIQKKPCNKNGCPALVGIDETYCPVHLPAYLEQKKKAACLYQKQYGNSAQRGYDRRWRKYRLHFLRLNPLCVECGAAATVVDHIIPHRGKYELFWAYDNHQPLCVRCHTKKTGRERTQGVGG